MNNIPAVTGKLAVLSATLLLAACGGGGGGGGGGGAGSGGGGAVPSVPPVVTPSGVPAAKTLFASLRTNVQAWSDSSQTGGKLATQYDGLRSDFNSASAAPLDSALVSWAQVAANGLDYFARFKAGSVSSPVLTLAGGSSCTMYSDAAATIKATSAANALNVGCVSQRTGAYLSGNATSSTYVLLGSEIVMTPVAGQVNSYTYAARATRATTTYGSQSSTSAKTTVGRYGSTDAARATGTVTYSKTGQDLATLAVDGMMPARMTNLGVAITDYEMWKLSMVRSNVDSSVLNYALSGELGSWLGGAAVSRVTVNSGSFIRMLVDKHDGADNLIREVNLAVAAEAGRSKLLGSIHLENFLADKNGRNPAPSKMSFTGSVSNNEAQFFAGTLGYDSVGYAQSDSNLPESATNFVKLTTAVTGTFTIAARPPLQLSYTLNNDTPTAIRETAQYKDGTLVINATSATNGSAAPVTTISSSDGVSVTLTGADTADVLKDGVKVAVINVKTAVITYVDGSFESLK